MQAFLDFVVKDIWQKVDLRVDCPNLQLKYLSNFPLILLGMLDGFVN